MRFLVDLQGAQSESGRRGIGRYVSSFAKALALRSGGTELDFLLSDAFPASIAAIRADLEQSVKREHISNWRPLVPATGNLVENYGRAEISRQIYQAAVVSRRADAFIAASFFEGFFDDCVVAVDNLAGELPTAAIFYDAIPARFACDYLADHRYRDWYWKKVDQLNKFEVLLAISACSKRDAVEIFGLDPSKIAIIGAGVDAQFCPKKSGKSSSGMRPYFLYAGGYDRRKNVELVFDAWARLDLSVRRQHQFVLAGSIGPHERSQLQARAALNGISQEEFEFVGYVEDEALVRLLRDAVAVVNPSLYEGFGLPVLEAMACGTPVIAANNSSMPEIIEREEFLFLDNDAKDLATHLERVATDISARMDRADYGLIRSRAFTWEAVADRALEALEGIARKPKARACDEITVELCSKIVGQLEPEVSDEELIKIAECISGSIRQTWRRQFLIDVSELIRRDARTGIQRVVRSVCRQILRNPPRGYEVHLVYGDLNGRYKYAPEFVGTLGEFSERPDRHGPVECWAGDLLLVLDYQAHVAVSARPFYKNLRDRGVRVEFVVYDLLSILRPDCFPAGTAEAFGNWLHTVAEADGAVCISRAVANELRDWITEHAPLRAKHFRIRWFHLGSDIENSLPTTGVPRNGQELLRAASGAPSILMLGTIEPRKGHLQALAAFEELWDEGVHVNLVIVGKQGWMMEEFVASLRRHPRLGTHLWFVDDASDEYLDAIYGVCDGLLAASEGEGFGLPLIEAAKRGLPIIVRDIPVFREVAGENAFYFSGTAASDLARAVGMWLRLRESGDEPRSDSIEALSWEESARLLVSRLELSA